MISAKGLKTFTTNNLSLTQFNCAVRECEPQYIKEETIEKANIIRQSLNILYKQSHQKIRWILKHNVMSIFKTKEKKKHPKTKAIELRKKSQHL